MALKILQINLNRARAAHALLDKTVSDLRIDVALIQEQNNNLEKSPYQDKEGNAAIRITNLAGTLVGKWGNRKGFVWIEVGEWTLFSCYHSPNKPDEDYNRFLDELGTLVAAQARRKVLVAGDFNAKSKSWGGNQENTRGTLIKELMAAHNLVIINQGDTPTFQRGSQKSYIDLTLTSANAADQIQEWTVHDEMEVLSDHNIITYNLYKKDQTATEPKYRRGWKVTNERMPVFKEKISEYWGTVGNITEIISEACDLAFPIDKGGTPHRKPIHWWNRDIADARARCIRARRQLTRARTNDGEVDPLRNEYKKLKNDLKRLIKKSKYAAWKDLINEIDSDVWGLGYKIATGKLKRQKLILSPEQTKEQVSLLFPTQPLDVGNTKQPKSKPTEFTSAELAEAIGKTKNKAPGIDGITAGILRGVMEANLPLLLEALNAQWGQATFPKEWKTARLVLLEKPRGEQDAMKTYRPICLLSELAKVYERILKGRLETELERHGGLHRDQYGFQRGRSTLDAIKRVTEIAKKCNSVSYQNRGFCVLITLDVKNAFNSISWRYILENLERRKINESVLSAVRSYLHDRTIVTDHGQSFQVTCGVPQGSVLGPVLWNVAYDDILKAEVPTNVTLVAFADDLAIVTEGKSMEEIKYKAEETINIVKEKMKEMGLSIAEQKTEIVILAGRRKLREIEIEVSPDKSVREINAAKYLGVCLDKDLRMTEHIHKQSSKADKLVSALSRLMPRTSGPKNKSRRMYAHVVWSVVLYAAPVWHQALKFKKYANMLGKINRNLALRISRGYRTISTEALLVMAKVPPMDLLVEERVDLQSGMPRKAARNKLLEAWQQRWVLSAQGWTRKIIPRIREWYDHECETNYHLTQCLSGHGVFNKYRKRIKKTEESKCWYCEGEDDVEHTIFLCPNWRDARTELTNSLNIELTPENFIEVFMDSRANEEKIQEYVKKIMKEKENHERQLETNDQQEP